MRGEEIGGRVTDDEVEALARALGITPETVAVRRDGPVPTAGTELTTDVSSLCLGV